MKKVFEKAKEKTKYEDKNWSAYGGILLNTRKGRSRARPLSTRDTMHLVLRSTKAVKEKSFSRKENKVKVLKIIHKFSEKHHIKAIRLAIVGNHMHFQMLVLKREGYKKFIRAVTSAIAISIQGHARWSGRKSLENEPKKESTESNLSLSNKKFWDYRPFSKIFYGQKAYLALKNYIEINQLEGLGALRSEAKKLIARYNLRDAQRTVKTLKPLRI